MEDLYNRTELLIGKEKLEKLKKSKVCIFGLGGVGSFVLEALARSGVCNFILVDNDKISITNLNRQLLATLDTVGRPKVDVAKERILSINKDIKCKTFNKMVLKDAESFIDIDTTYIVDAIDNVTAKLNIIKTAKEKNIKIISSLGTANKLDASAFEITDIYKTKVCPLAKIIRKELKKMNISSLKVLYSSEEPIKPQGLEKGTISYVPSTAGLLIAGEVIKDIIEG